MKKEVKKYTVIKSVTEDGIKNVGINKWLISKKKVWWSFAPILLVLFGLTFVEKLPRVIGILGSVIIALYGIYYCYGIWKSGKDFFNKVKDLPEPIDLREIK
jgi:hypothetical protein